MSSIENHPSGEKFHLMSTVWFILWGRFMAWHQRVFPFVWSWQSFCYTLFEFNSNDICWDNAKYQLTFPPTTYEEIGRPFTGISLKLKGLFQSLSCLIGLPMLQFHVCNTYVVMTPTLPQCRNTFLPGQGNRSSRLGYGDIGCRLVQLDEGIVGRVSGYYGHSPRAYADCARHCMPPESNQRNSTSCNMYSTSGLSTSYTTPSPKP